MLILGATLAAASGLAYSATGALQKHETVRARVPAPRLLPALLKRPLWLLAVLLDVGAWVAQAAGLALAPIALVVPLMAVGSALLVLLGVRWLGERFGPLELTAIALVAAGGSAAAVAAAGVSPARAALDASTQLGLAAGAALLVSRGRGGIALGAAAGCLFAATVIWTKEVGDRLAANGWRGLELLLVSPAPWLLALFGVGALWTARRNVPLTGPCFHQPHGTTLRRAASTRAGCSVSGAAILFRGRRLRLLSIVVCAVGDASPELADPFAEVASQRGQSAGAKQDREDQNDDEVLLVHLQRFPASTTNRRRHGVTSKPQRPTGGMRIR